MNGSLTNATTESILDSPGEYYWWPIPKLKIPRKLKKAIKKKILSECSPELGWRAQDIKILHYNFGKSIEENEYEITIEVKRR